MASFVKEIENDAIFQAELDGAGSKVVIVDFHATWCGPCKRIAPVFTSLSVKYNQQAVFLKVDVDKCKTVAERYSVTAMPTFIFIRAKVKIDELKGADPNSLQEKVKQHAIASGDSLGDGDEDVKGYTDLKPFILPAGCNCLNESDDHTHSKVFEKENGYLESDCDEQLILTIAFSQAVKIHSLKIEAPNDGRAPKTIKIFTNQPSSVDFDQAEGMEAIQKLDLTPEDVSGEKVIPLRFVKFQNVTNLVLFVANNQGDEDTSVISYLKVIGIPLDATNMKDFKRVAGKAGESH